MVVVHKEGKVLLKDITVVANDLKMVGNAVLTEDEARRLVSKEEGPIFVQAVEEARKYNRDAKRKRIEELEVELKKLKETL